MHLYRPPPVPSIHLIIDVGCLHVIGEMSLWGKDKVVFELWITEKCLDTRQNLVTVEFEVFTPHNYIRKK